MASDRAMGGFEARKLSARRGIAGGKNVIQKCRERNRKLHVARQSVRSRLLDAANKKKKFPDKLIDTLLSHHRAVEEDLKKCERLLKTLEDRSAGLDDAYAGFRETVLRDLWELRNTLHAKNVTNDFTGFRFPGEKLGGSGDSSVLAHWLPTE